MGYVTADAVRVIETELRNRGFKDEKRGNWRGNHPGGDSRGLRVTIAPVEGSDKWNVVFSDHSRGAAGGGAQQLAELLQFSLPEAPKKERGKAEQTKRAYRDLQEYALAHGISADVLKDAGWSDRTMKRDADRGERPCFTFSTATGTRFRFIDGDKPYYKSVLDYRACWYRLDEALAMARASGLPLVLCNGEVSTVVGQHFGIPATAVTGGENRYSDALAQELLQKWDGAILLAYDCDEAGKRMTAETAKQFPRAQPVDLELTDGGDLADLCKLYTVDAPQRLKDLASAQKTPEIAQNSNDLAMLNKTLKEVAETAKINDQAALITALNRAQAELDRVNKRVRPVRKKSGKELAAEETEHLRWRMANRNALLGLSTGIHKLDMALGGMSGTVAFYGAPSMGKSTLLTQIATNLCKQGLKGGIAPTESTSGKWMAKMAAALTGINSREILRGQLFEDEAQRVTDAYSLFGNNVIDWLDESNPSPVTFRQFCLDLVTSGAQFIILDSMSNVDAGYETIYDNTAKTSRAIQNVSTEIANMGYDCPIIMSVQVDTSSAKRATVPSMTDSRGGGEPARDFDTIAALFYYQYYVEQGIAKPNEKYPENCALIRIRKQRWGQNSTGCKLYYNRGVGFSDWEQDGYAEGYGKPEAVQHYASDHDSSDDGQEDENEEVAQLQF